MTRRMFLGALPVAGAWARSWERPAFPNWDADFIDEMLTDSPWARPLTVKFPWQPAAQQQPLLSGFMQLAGDIPLPGRIPGGGRTTGGGPRPESRRPGPIQPVQTEMYLVVRFSSALPIRQALALAEYGRAGLDDPRAVELLTTDPEECVVEVAGFPAISMNRGAAALAEDLRKSARLTVKGASPVAAKTAEVPEHGMHLVATLRFPRLGDLPAGEGVLQFAASSGPIRIEQASKLKPMVYRGRLEV